MGNLSWRPMVEHLREGQDSARAVVSMKRMVRFIKQQLDGCIDDVVWCN